MMVHKILAEVWNRQGKGYICISEKSEDGWSDNFFRWPGDKSKIAGVVDSANENDLYFCPMVFTKPKRRKELVKSSSVLFADLDPVNPKLVHPRPSIAWESSRNRYQAIWLLDRTLSIDEFERANRALTYGIGADKGGWDVTQVLRVPGSMNYKYDPPSPGRLMWANKKTISPDIPQDDELEETQDLISLLQQYKTQIPRQISRMLQYPPQQVTVGKRSDILWAIESELVKAKVPLEDAFEIIKASAWNKYRGRRDEDVRIRSELEKVYSQKSLRQAPTLSSRIQPVTLEEFLGQPPIKTQWLVEEIWTKGANGAISGEPKTYKSTIALDLAVSVASGEPLWDRYEVHEKGPVLYIQNENADWIIKDRLEKIMSSKGLVGSAEVRGSSLLVEFPPALPIHLLNNTGFTFSTDDNREALEEVIEAIRPVLVIFDPLYLMFEGDVNSAQELQPILQWFMHLKQNYKTAVMVIHHSGKNSTNRRGGQRMLGSTTLHGWTESALYLEEIMDITGNRSIVVEREFRGCAVKGHIRLNLDMGEVGDDKYQVTVDDATSPVDTLLDLQELYPQGLTANAIAKELGISRRKAAQLLEQMPGSGVAQDRTGNAQPHSKKGK